MKSKSKTNAVISGLTSCPPPYHSKSHSRREWLLTCHSVIIDCYKLTFRSYERTLKNGCSRAVLDDYERTFR